MRKIYILALVILAGCTGGIDSARIVESCPDIFPDYIDVTVPSNIAPLNFNFISNNKLSKTCTKVWAAKFETDKLTVLIKAKQDGLVRISPKQWRELTSSSEIKVRCYERTGNGWIQYKEFSIKVSKDTIDPYIAYRLIPPGYEVWGEMGIYQRCLESYEESAIIDNSNTGTNCMNCHSFAGRDPGTFLFHMRAQNGGTYLVKNNKIEKLNTKTPETIAALVYPQWSIKGDCVAFSVNDIAQFFHSTNPNKIEVYDYKSDVVVYDVENHNIAFSSLTKSEDYLETFPTFSPDGRTLYFCRSKAVENMPENYRDARYNIVRISFDPETMSFVNELETVYDAESENHSATFPRISPDGKFLVVTRMDYGQFPIWHKEAQLFLINLETGEKRELDAFNSDDADSYHGWSSNGRWMVFSSRRDDGLYTKPYLGHIDENGNPEKPFLLPQENPYKYYKEQMSSYNLPDFILGKVKVSKKEIENIAINDKGINIGVK